MSLNINEDKIIGVLLPVVGWVGVATLKGADRNKSSFYLDAYEYSDTDRLDNEHVPYTGFSFIDSQGFVVNGPITSILAIRLGKQR